MKISCGIINDLLPLYHDNICSEESRIIVQEHLKTCESCRALLDQMDEDFCYKEKNIEIEPVRQAARALNKSKAKSFLKGGLLLAMLACICCFIAYNVIGSYVAADGTLVEPFYLIPLAWLFFFFGLLNALALLVVSIKNRMR